MGTRKFRRDHSKDTVPPIPTSPRKVPPPLLPRPSRETIVKSLADSSQGTVRNPIPGQDTASLSRTEGPYHKTAVEIYDSDSQQRHLSFGSETDEYETSHFIVRADIHARPPSGGETSNMEEPYQRTAIKVYDSDSQERHVSFGLETDDDHELSATGLHSYHSGQETASLDSRNPNLRTSNIEQPYQRTAVKIYDSDSQQRHLSFGSETDNE